MRALAADFEDVLGTCQFSLEGMQYNPAEVLTVNSTSVFFPAASWLRAFFHDAGTFIKQPSKGGPKGECSRAASRAGSRGVGEGVSAVLVETHVLLPRHTQYVGLCAQGSRQLDRCAAGAVLHLASSVCLPLFCCCLDLLLLTGGPNGSLGVGCNSNPCGDLGVAVPVTPTATCSNLEKAVSGFSDGLSYCCPEATQCVAHGQSANSGPDPGETVPVCLTGHPTTVELCRRENDNLLPTIQVRHKGLPKLQLEHSGPQCKDNAR